MCTALGAEFALDQGGKNGNSYRLQHECSFSSSPVIFVNLTLWTLRKGQRGVISGFDQRLQPAYRVRLAEVGFHPGETVRCMLSPAFGAPKVYRVSNTMFSLDEDVAGYVLVNADG